jgi:hypothetical protein
MDAVRVEVEDLMQQSYVYLLLSPSVGTSIRGFALNLPQSKCSNSVYLAGSA